MTKLPVGNLPDWLWRQIGCSETPCAPHSQMIDGKVLMSQLQTWREIALAVGAERDTLKAERDALCNRAEDAEAERDALRAIIDAQVAFRKGANEALP